MTSESPRRRTEQTSSGLPEGEDSDMEDSENRDYQGYQLLGEAQGVNFESFDGSLSNGWHTLPVDDLPNNHQGTGASSTSSDWEDGEDTDRGTVSLAGDAEQGHVIYGDRSENEPHVLPNGTGQFLLQQGAVLDHRSVQQLSGTSLDFSRGYPRGDMPGALLDEASRRYIRRLAAEHASEAHSIAVQERQGSATQEMFESEPSIGARHGGMVSAERDVAIADGGETSGDEPGEQAARESGSGTGARLLEKGNEAGMEMTPERRTAILAALKNFSLPYFPTWAVHVPEEQWVGALRNRSGILPTLQNGEGVGEREDDMRS